jgi:hypothetical protein
VVGDIDTKVRREDSFKPEVGIESLHKTWNDNGVRVVSKCQKMY